ncbi:hypothetical protein G9409_10225 [Chlorobium sp. BLA1]|uniref:hypothetical protein n=1 Tax=Candidatus Chlorobium masyuteum TaxID=2716876 RepID=UPI00141FE171|nr:hypothetical protein [Candidatus Chlorobium masyuteum]NHQ60950.1 hypothetical protein [Candidatus Chlorobium masyuteum]NTU45676.1 hypothetical protein [Chlorobiaceae bacterium]
MERKLFISKFDRQLKAWDRDIAKLEKKAEKITQNLKQHIETVKHQREAASTKATDLMHSSEEAWNEVKYGAERAMTDLKKAFKKAKSKF